MNATASRSDRAEAGSILLIVVLLVGAVLITATVVGVAMNRNLDRQRAVATQTQLESAWHGLFGPPMRSASATILRRKQGNMRADFLLNPTTTSNTLYPTFTPDLTYATGFATGHVPDLKAMTTRTSVLDLEPGQTNYAAFTGTLPANTNNNIAAWNGPYWNGSVDASNRPVDAWGRPFQLRYISGVPGWQVYSLGANGVDNTGNLETPAGDDLAYPIPPATLPVFATSASTVTCSSSSVTITRTAFTPAETLTLTITDSNGATQTLSLNITNGGDNTVTFNFTTSFQGSITYTMTSSKAGNPHYRGPWASPVGGIPLTSTCTTPISI